MKSILTFCSKVVGKEFITSCKFFMRMTCKLCIVARKDGKVEDYRRQLVEHYKDTPEILKRLHGEGYTLAVASRTGATDDANSLLKLFDWDKYFTYKEIYPGSKVAHFKR